MLEHSRDLSQNPCHMCMPMGGILALKGVEGSMALLHGSQGCSTYMRRHIAEHFNEPVDVASSSLNEKGTVYGGQANLKKAMDNVRRVYNPKIIGILTTCLAETIGEDIRRIACEYQQETECDCRIVTAATPGYGGTHTEGYWSTLRELVAQLALPTSLHAGVNIIVPAALSPADLREIKRCLDLFGVDYTLLPDISETMDRPYESSYEKIADGGTSLASIGRMSGAVATLELGGPVDEKMSPGAWLRDSHSVPLVRLPIPIGLANTDLFLQALTVATGKVAPPSLQRERGLLMDAMIDAHKYSFRVRPVLFGDPELVYTLTGFCAENGMFPRVAATGGGSGAWRESVRQLLSEALEPARVMEETDMAKILSQSMSAGVNLAVGPSVGRYLEEQADIPLVRIGFPIQDRQGAQRILSVGYTGTALLLDKCVNTFLERKHKTYREDLYDAYYDEEEVECHAV
ncbi:MAG TPA: nitrogenase component 1 [Negativicutes bacterium]|nr:nitrogenase component 1 [Negativicutes bacterium]